MSKSLELLPAVPWVTRCLGAILRSEREVSLRAQVPTVEPALRQAGISPACFEGSWMDGLLSRAALHPYDSSTLELEGNVARMFLTEICHFFS